MFNSPPVAGSIVSAGAGALVGAGIPEHEAKLYEDEIRNGSVLIVVDSKNDERAERIEKIFNNEDAYNIAA